ncbi:prepilin peptidase [Serinibacter arcticus]|nr:prepilin peptidase [Serinibacter arcticus]
MTGLTLALTALGAALLGAAGAMAAGRLARLVPASGRPGAWFLHPAAVAVAGVLTGLVAGLHVHATGQPWTWPAVLVALAAATAACLVDAAGHRLPDVLVLRGWAAASLLLLASLPLSDPHRVLLALAASAACWIVLTLVVLAVPRALGYGDVKLVGLLGLVSGLLGPTSVAVTLVAGVVLGGVAALVLLALRRADRGTPLAFGPWLLAGTGWAVVAAVLPTP